MRTRTQLISTVAALALLLAACSSQPASKPAAHSASQAQAATPASAQTNPSGETPTAAASQPTGNSLTAKLSEIVGQVLARESQDASFVQSTPGYILQLLGQVQTKADGKVRLDLSTGSLMRLGPNTLFTLQPTQTSSQGLIVHLEMDLGQLWIILRGGGSIQVQTKSGVAAVLGSYMGVSYDPGTGLLRITCLEGHRSLTTNAGTVQLTSGQTAWVTGINQYPQVGVMTTQDFQAWLNTNPEAAVYASTGAGGGSGSGSSGHQSSTSDRGKGQGVGQGSGKGGSKGGGQGGGK